LTVENLFTWSFNQSDFQCEWTFWTWSFTSWTDKKCNPWYVTYGTWVHEILLRLSEKTHPNNFLTWSIIVLNWIDYDFWLSGTWKILSWSGTESIWSSQTWTLAYNTLSWTTIPKTWAVNTFLSSNTENSTEENFINQSISILTDLQQPSYVTWVGDVFHCDQSKQECKVNFNFTVLENLEKTTSYTCQIQTSIDSKMLESCNPATMIFSNTQNSVYIWIHDKETHNLVYEKEISIINNWYINPRTSKNASVETKEIAKKLTIRLSEIEIQSWLDADNLCKKSDCKVNLKYIEKKWEKCEWNFPKWEYDNKTRFKCNPGYIKYEKYWEYEIELKVYDKNHKNNFKIQKLRFSNIPETAKNKENAIIDEQENPEKSHIDYINFDTDFAIDLQWRKSKNKVFSGSIIFCYAEPCNINLDWSNSVRSNWEKIELYWELWENTFEWNNPKALWFNSWSHLISIKDWENTKNITLIVDKNANTFWLLQEKKDTTVIEKIDQIEIDQNILDYLKISEVLPNPHWIDNNEYIEIKNTWKFSINLLWVALDDILDWWSKKFIIDKTIILPAWEKIKWYKYDTKINLNNNQDNVHLSYNNTIIDSLSWDYNLADNYIITHQNSDIGSQEVQIMRIIDWDTIEIKLENWEIEKLRLIWVDTPEVYNSANTLELQYGKIASAYTKNMLLWKTLKLEIESWNFRDAYGRLLGYIYLENWELFNENLIRNWYSRAYLVYNFKYSKNFKSAETKAKKENLIIWWNAEYKKIVNKIIKNDKIAIEESEKHKDKLTAEAFYIDSDDNKIPDSFQISLINNENIIYSTWWMERYNIFIQNSFHINISQLNAGIKVSWKTISNAQLTFKISDRMYSTITDNSWKFSLNIWSDFLASEYTVNSYIIDVYWNNFRLEKIKEFKITKEYLQKLANIEKEKLEKESVKKAKALARERKKIEKRKIAAKWKIYSSIFIKQTQAYNENTSIGSIVPTHKNILTFLIIILSLLMSFFILKRKKLL
jgi:endonuclease YncB( thermonuclease family)